MPDVMRKLDGGASVIDAEPFSVKNIFVDHRMKVGETLGKLDFGVVHGKRTVREPAFVNARLRQVVLVDREEPADPRLLKFQIAPTLVGEA